MTEIIPRATVPSAASALLAAAGIAIGQDFYHLQPHQLAAIRRAADEHRRRKYGSTNARATPQLMRRFYDLVQRRAARQPGHQPPQTGASPGQ